MDNLTHSLVGLTAAKAGLERLSPGATAICFLAANAPDSDIAVLIFGDRWDFLQYHRGITHSLLGTACLSILLPLIFYLVDRLIARLRNRAPVVRFKGLLVASLLVGFTHPILDWTNNYGIRFFLPWDARWFYGDLVFIVDPFIWLMLGGATFLLAPQNKKRKAFWLVVAVVTTLIVIVGSRQTNLRYVLLAVWFVSLVGFAALSYKGIREGWKKKVPVIALGTLVIYIGALAFAHQQALARARMQAHQSVSSSGEQINRLVAMPTVADPFDWDCIFETDRATYRFRVSLISTGVQSNLVRYDKSPPGLSEAWRHLDGDRRVKAFMGFARFPVALLLDSDCTTQTLVQIADLRYTEPGRSRGTFSLELPVDCPTEVVESR